jgi:hypothetical protein
MEWTADDADIDLWVDEPNGERVYDGDQLSSAGGQISNDMTDGYGPEEYAIRRGPAGTYGVRVRIDDQNLVNAGFTCARVSPMHHIACRKFEPAEAARHELFRCDWPEFIHIEIGQYRVTDRGTTDMHREISLVCTNHRRIVDKFCHIASRI